ncbi:LytR/AlgR family response regulator transcription factor [Haloimpatiens sp. FM7315]|uniref:LytR/AlgR family response regulator transcription factor n=1 Tax=Haloimpatiens sp. FM7315 TaxID=3298609 RepID=UPI0035A27882
MNCIIVDDEYPAREELKYFIDNYSNLNMLDEFDDATLALKFIEKNVPDIIFLDINMPKISGMDIARIINKFKKKIYIIFITAYKEHALEAFEIEAFDYILKPYSEDRIINTLKRLDRIEREVKSKPSKNKITVWKDNKMLVLNINDIYYCKAEEGETIVCTEKEDYILNQTLSHIEKKLSSKIFFRTHRSYLVNLDKIKEINPWFNNTYMVKLDKINVEVPVSRNNISDFKHIMGI